jgi:hypothetical protein
MEIDRVREEQGGRNGVLPALPLANNARIGPCFPRATNHFSFAYGVPPRKLALNRMLNVGQCNVM